MRERHWVIASHTHLAICALTGDWIHSPGMCPDWGTKPMTFPFAGWHPTNWSMEMRDTSLPISRMATLHWKEHTEWCKAVALSSAEMGQVWPEMWHVGTAILKEIVRFTGKKDASSVLPMLYTRTLWFFLPEMMATFKSCWGFLATRNPLKRYINLRCMA